MKIFKCGHCDHPLFFENIDCGNCGHLSGYRDDDRQMLTFDPTRTSLLSDREKIVYKYCKNREHGICNWLIPENAEEVFCRACQLNRTIPDLSNKINLQRWKSLEVAKHRLIYQLQKIGLDLRSRMTHPDGLCFDFIAKNDNADIMTGHASGVITILLREADDVLREQAKQEMEERYRTLIGHLRHEVGHYFWEQLIAKDQSALRSFRDFFGNEEANYGDALKAYYKNGAPENWRDSYISKYATSHPWEDWAETWAHYLHIMDMVETAHFFGLEVNHKDILENMKIASSFDPYTIEDFETIVQTCVPLSFAVNSINRAMGIPDVYPFVITPAVVNKMKFIHQLLLPKRKL
ncbi:putative zinc-binding metallopeptidase [Maribacter sp. 2210JD10-5]|uniref:zinc-binding metallopeptidase family protein n=1 Tax=Maribacter sp. 2210JD10-5 TaxID=3386272 RepID=UPI0039BD1BA5